MLNKLPNLIKIISDDRYISSAFALVAAAKDYCELAKDKLSVTVRN